MPATSETLLIKSATSINSFIIEQLVNEQIEGGTDAIIVCGTTGEASTLTHEEHLDLIRFCVEKVNGRVPVIAGTGSNCTKTAVYLSPEAENSVHSLTTVFGIRLQPVLPGTL